MYELCRHCCEPPSAHAASRKCLFMQTSFDVNRCKRCGSPFVYSSSGRAFALKYWVDHCLSCLYKNNYEKERT